MNYAAISFVQREDGKILVVWNQHFGGWALPGGKVEDGETIAMAQARELREETGLETTCAIEMYQGLAGDESGIDFGRAVHVFKVDVAGEPFAGEPDCPVVWMGITEFLRMTVFGDFYKHMFEDFILVGDCEEARNVWGAHVTDVLSEFERAVSQVGS